MNCCFLFVDDVDGEDAEAVVADYGARGSVFVECALRYLQKKYNLDLLGTVKNKNCLNTLKYKKTLPTPCKLNSKCCFP